MDAAKFGHDIGPATKSGLRCSKISVNGMNKCAIIERTWIRQVLAKYEAIEKLQPKTFDLIVEEWPDWVVRAFSI